MGPRIDLFIMLMLMLMMMEKSEANMGATRLVRFEKKPDSIYRAAWRVDPVRGSAMEQERQCYYNCKMEANCGALFIQDSKCHLVAPAVVDLDPSVAMKYQPGVHSYYMVGKEAFKPQTPVPGGDYSAPLSSPGTGNDQSWTTTAAGGSDWTAPEGTFTVPPTTTTAASTTGNTTYGSGSAPQGSGNGEAQCEGHGYQAAQCLAVGCCEFEEGQCWSAVGDGPCGSGSEGASSGSGEGDSGDPFGSGMPSTDPYGSGMGSDGDLYGSGDPYGSGMPSGGEFSMGPDFGGSTTTEPARG